MRRVAGPHLLVVVATALCVACGGPAEASGPGADGGIRVAAASDLRTAFTEIGARFTARSDVPVSFTFGSSGQLGRQVVDGAPFDVFASAGAEYVDAVIDSGRGDGSTRYEYARGRLVMWAPDGADLPASVADLGRADAGRVVIANPAHAPYGRAARQALQRTDVWDALSERLVFGESAVDAVRIARSGNADVALAALSLVQEEEGRYELVHAGLHEPLEQSLVVVEGDHTADARRFARFVASAEGRAVMARHGLVRQGEDPSGR